MYIYPCPEEDRIIEQHYPITVVQIGLSRIEEFTRFIFGVFARQIARRQGWEPTEADLNTLLEEEFRLAPHGVYNGFCLPDGSIIGGIRSIKWHPDVVFPSERIFGVNTVEMAKERKINLKRLWHSSQMGIDNETLRMSKHGKQVHRLVSRLMTLHSIRAMNDMGADYWIYESDPTVVRRLELLGIHSQTHTGLRD